MNEIIQLLKETTPIVWDSAVHYAYIVGFWNVVASIIFGIISVAFVKFAKDEKDEALFLGTIVFGILFLICFIYGTSHLIAPNYFAYKSLLP